MAIQQTMLATSFTFVPNKPFTNPIIPSLSLNPKRLLGGGVKCYMDYNGAGAGAGNNQSMEVRQYPRPSEIEWKKEISNTVQLIGNVGTSVQTKQVSSGKVLAWCRLAVKTSSTSSDTTWVNLTFWDELALVAFQHVEKGNRIFVSGRLVSNTVESDDSKPQTYYKVVVQQLNFVESNLSLESSYDNSSNSANAERMLKTRATNSTGSVEELWQAYFANPVEWWDNRKDKKTPNYPDFKHKDTGEALWVDGRNNPSWVKSQLSILDSKMEAYNNQNPSTRTTFSASDFSPY